MNNETIVDSIKTLCKNKNISASQLEKEIGLSQGLISKWTKTMPSLDKIIGIADYFHVSLDEVIGRHENIDDEFLKTIYEYTNSKALNWHSTDDGMLDNKIYVPHDLYDNDKFAKLTYYTEFNDGFFIIDCLCEQIINPYELNFCIRPNKNADLIFQKYTTEQLKPLWISIIYNLPITNTPDELKAENLKQRFIETSKHIEYGQQFSIQELYDKSKRIDLNKMQ